MQAVESSALQVVNGNHYCPKQRFALQKNTSVAENRASVQREKLSVN
jgi:hypothetical protein